MVFLSGCFSSGPINNKNFETIKQISKLNGVYKNLGDKESDSYNYPIYLSKIIWPNDKALNQLYGAIDTISVKSLNSTQLEVIARQGQNIVKKQIFVEGKDFRFHTGRIQLVTEIDGINDNFIGVTHTSIYLGLDQVGNGKYRKSESFAGFALIIPIVAKNVTDVRFIKLRN